MVLYVWDVKKEGKLVALDAHGNECTAALLECVAAPSRIKLSEDDVRPEEFTRSFFRLDDEAKDLYGTDADYAISRELFNAACDLITGAWNDLVRTVSSVPATEKNTSEIMNAIPENCSPKTLIRYLF